MLINTISAEETPPPPPLPVGNNVVTNNHCPSLVRDFLLPLSTCVVPILISCLSLGYSTLLESAPSDNVGVLLLLYAHPRSACQCISFVIGCENSTKAKNKSVHYISQTVLCCASSTLRPCVFENECMYVANEPQLQSSSLAVHVLAS